MRPRKTGVARHLEVAPGPLRTGEVATRTPPRPVPASPLSIEAQSKK
jgi:hypothetical protein